MVEGRCLDPGWAVNRYLELAAVAISVGSSVSLIYLHNRTQGFQLLTDPPSRVNEERVGECSQRSALSDWTR